MFLEIFEISKNKFCYRTPSVAASVGLILTNRPSYFQHSNVFETAISDFHLLIATQLKMRFQKKLPKLIAYCDYKKNGNAKFCDDVNNFAFSQFDVKCI